MADKKITQLTNITGANLVDADEFVVVDISADETKAITLGELKEAFDSGSGFVRITGDTMTGDLALSGADVTFGDNDKAIFGAGSDLQIYHNGGQSIIEDAGQGNLVILATDFYLNNSANTENMLSAINDGAVTLYYNGSPKLATTSTGVDITGTLTSDGLTVAGLLEVDGSANGNSASFALTRTDASWSIDNETNLRIYGNAGDTTNPATKRMEIGHSTGDISFYEDTGTTPKFFWDASAESLGIGTSSPSRPLTVSTANNVPAEFDHTDGTDVWLKLNNTTQNYYIGYVGTDFVLSPDTASRDLTIDSSGNLLVGKTSQNIGTVGFEATPSSSFQANASTANGKATHTFNRLTSDGDIATFRKDGTTVGSIGSRSSDLVVGTGDTGLQFYDFGNAIFPINISTNSNRDAAIDLGEASNRFKDLYLSGATNYGSSADFGQIRKTGGELQIDSYGTGGARNPIKFTQYTSEVARFDSSGNLLVGKTGANSNLTGVQAISDGRLFATTSGSYALVGNRLSSDGDIAKFQKDGTTVGSIGTKDGDLTIGTGDTGLYFSDGADSVYPYNTSTLADRDAAVDLGYPTVRFKDLYLSGGVYLGGTGAANKLDDYEEGSFTPTIANLTNLTGTASITRAIYTKVGNLCTIQVRISGLTITSASANSVFSATLPTAAAMDASGTPAVMGVARGTSSFASGVVADYTGGNATQVQVLFLAETTASSGTLDIEYSLTYRTA